MTRSPSQEAVAALAGTLQEKMNLDSGTHKILQDNIDGLLQWLAEDPQANDQLDFTAVAHILSASKVAEAAPFEKICRTLSSVQK